MTAATPDLGTRAPTARSLVQLLCILATGCGGSPSGPTTPAEPTGTILALHPVGDLYVVDAAAGEPKLFSQFGEPILWTNATLGPDGTAISGSSSLASNELRVIDLRTGAIATVAQLTSEILVGSTRISPDGQTVAIAALGWTESGGRALVTVELASNEAEVRWTPPPDNPQIELADLHWLPDQSGFIALAQYPDGGQVVHFDLASRVISPITPFDGNAVIRTVDLSPDGRTIAFVETPGRIRFVTRQGDPAQGFPDAIENAVLPAFSPDGKLLAYSRLAPGTPGGAEGIWIHRFSDGQESRLLPAGSPVTWVLDWE